MIGGEIGWPLWLPFTRFDCNTFDCNTFTFPGKKSSIINHRWTLGVVVVVGFLFSRLRSVRMFQSLEPLVAIKILAGKLTLTTISQFHIYERLLLLLLLPQLSETTQLTNATSAPPRPLLYPVKSIRTAISIPFQ